MGTTKRRAFRRGHFGGQVNPKIRAVSLDIEGLWELTGVTRKEGSGEAQALSDLIENHNRKIIDIIMAQVEPVGPA